MKNFSPDVWLGRFLAAVLLSIAFSVLFTPIYNYDLFWHLSAGKYIFQNLALPKTDFLSWTKTGTPWMDFEWLAQVIYYLLYLAGGIQALYCWKIVLMLILFLLFKKTLVLHTANLIRKQTPPTIEGRLPSGSGQTNLREDFSRGIKGAFFAYALFALLIFPNSDLRVDNYSLIFFALELYFFERAFSSGMLWNRKVYLVFFCFYSLWANLHAGFIFGLLLILFYMSGLIIDGLYNRKKNGVLTDCLNKAKSVFVCFLFAFLGTIANPFGTKIYGVVLRHLSDMPAISRYVTEWAPPRLSNPFHWVYMLALFFSLAFMALLVAKKKKFHFAHILILLYFAFVSSQHTRHIGFFSIAFSFIMPYYFRKENFLSRKWLARQFVFAFIAAVFCFMYIWPFTFKTLLIPLFPRKNAISFLRENASKLADLRMYNPWRWGGYLGFYLSPPYKIFVDGRYIFHDYAAEISIAESSPFFFKRFAKRRKLSLAIIERNYRLREVRMCEGNACFKIARPEYLFYFPPKDWTLVWWDMNSLVFVKKEHLSSNWSEDEKYSVFLPDDMAHIRLKILNDASFATKLKSEMQKYAETHRDALDMKYLQYVRKSLNKKP